MKKSLLTIVVAQFFCTSLWFAGNAILSDLIKSLNLQASFMANLTSSVQFGFIVGTFLFAFLSISDRFSPSKVFAFSALIAAIFNLGMAINGITEFHLLAFRFFTGFFLAGIYPVGMKIASDYEEKGLGKSLGFLVGALVLGTAFPHLLKSFTTQFPWQNVIYGTSFLAVIGGSLIYFLPDGPFRKPNPKLKWNAFFEGFKTKKFRSAAFGYFGHMWELYAFWAFVPFILTNNHSLQKIQNIAILSFFIIGIGCLACIFSGLLSQKYGAKRVAFICLLLSTVCCLTSPAFLQQSPIVFMLFMLFWGMVVVADSPLFSTLVAQNAPQQNRGTALTIVNCIGFSITIISIQFLQTISLQINIQYLYMLLALGPILGLYALLQKQQA
ncbi:MFS transporter [Pedobacter sp. SD-b]|uniref:MFS transporter n=1 Tax=Pedobacter segetis TaxID=2793069 RepID=A0ABS1BLK8_9SPHI|nr:MFS transporter [Pedobacter segetis]MBK0383201.1 MFS transporter [Pedobacter segetis]